MDVFDWKIWEQEMNKLSLNLTNCCTCCHDADAHARYLYYLERECLPKGLVFCKNLN